MNRKPTLDNEESARWRVRAAWAKALGLLPMLALIGAAAAAYEIRGAVPEGAASWIAASAQPAIDHSIVARAVDEPPAADIVLAADSAELAPCWAYWKLSVQC